MKQEGSKCGTIGTSLRKIIILAHLESFQHFFSMPEPHKHFLKGKL